MSRVTSKYATKRIFSPIKRMKKGFCLNLCKLFFAALPTIVFGLFTIIFSLQQDASARATREQDQRQADEINRRIIFKEYIDDMKELLLDEHFTENMNRSLLQMRIQTLTVLRHLDPPRKYDVILFLYENHLIRHDQPPTIDLSGANLTGVKFTLSSMAACNLSYLYLPRVYAKDIVFESCQLDQAIFDHAVMIGARFDSCYLSSTSFIKTNLTQARFANNFAFQANFMGTQMTQAMLRKGIIMDSDFVNVDLYQSDVSEYMLKTEKTGVTKANRILNTRLPNGTFSRIDDNNLIIDDQAEPLCHHKSTQHWINIATTTPAAIIDTNFIRNISTFPTGDGCFFRVDTNSSVGQYPSTENFTVLINQKQAMFNLSLWLGLINSTDQDAISVTVHFAQETGGFDVATSQKKTIRNPASLQFCSLVELIPPQTNRLYINLACNATSSENQFCFFNHIILKIFKA